MRSTLLVLAALAAGCLSPAAPLEGASVETLLVDGVAGDAARWNGTRLDGGPLTGEMQLNDYRCWMKLPCERALAACDAANCERRPFELAGEAAAVVLSVRWPSVPDAKFDAWIESAEGEVLAVAPREYVSYIGLVARIEGPAPGAYTAVIVARAGNFPYEAALRVEPRVEPDEPRALLPNLVTLPPTDLLLETPTYTGVSYFAMPFPGVREASEALGVKGCRLDERAERGHVRCLRFSNAVANLGEGPLDVRLPAGQLAFTQLVHWSDGSVEASPGGAAEWHAIHAHWHNAASNEFTVRPFDPATRAMGEPLGSGTKGGICFADTATTDVGLPIMRPAAFTGWNCFQPGATDRSAEWSMGITPGWYDLYAYPLSDQYVDIGSLEDGTYALCSVTNAEGTLLESDLSDNEACTAFRLTGDQLELLDPEPYHTIPDEYRI